MRILRIRQFMYLRNLVGAVSFAMLTVSTVKAEPDCDRECLVELADNYLAALAAQDPDAAPLADDIAFVENVTRMAPGEGSWKDITGMSPSYRIYVPDPDQGSIGLMAFVERKEGPALLAVRMKVDNGKITEAEHLLGEILPGSELTMHSSPRANLVAAVPESRRMSRSELARIAGSYYDSLNLGDGALAPFGTDCERLENGMVTAAYYLEPVVFDAIDVNDNPPPAVARDCIGQMNSNRFAYIDSIDNRRIVAIDPEHGLVMGLSHFRQSMAHGAHPMIAADGSEVMWEEKRDPYDLPAAHIFKITDGEIHQVEAIGVFVPYNSPTGWE